MLRALILTLAGATFVSPHADARLWETKVQVDARYGGSVKKLQAGPGEEMLQYRYKDFDVIVTFVGGKS